jgi:hypothetical protein
MQSLLHSEFMRTVATDRARRPAIQSRPEKRPRRPLPVVTYRLRRRPNVVRGRA